MESTGKKGPAVTGPSKPTIPSKPRFNTNKPPKKIHRILAAFSRGENLNFIEAQQVYHDRSLHSTVSEIQHDYQILIARETEIIAGFMGLPTRCRRYRMEADQQEKARKVLAALR